MKITELAKFFCHANTLSPAYPIVLLYELGEEYEGSEAEKRRAYLDWLLPEFGDREIYGMRLATHCYKPELRIWMTPKEAKKK